MAAEAETEVTPIDAFQQDEPAGNDERTLRHQETALPTHQSSTMSISTTTIARETITVSDAVKAAMESIEVKEAAEVPEGLAWAITHGRSFNIVMAVVIAINTIYLGIETDMDIGELESNIVWFCCELGFTVVFCIELIFRLFAERRFFFRDRWNCFDFLLVFITCSDTFILQNIAQEGGTQNFVSIIRVLRLFRIARIVRLLRFFETLWLLIIGVCDAMRTLVWAWVLITIIIFVFAIFMTRAMGIPHGKEDWVVQEQFGRVENSMFTLFQIMTLEGWPDIARNAMDYEPWIWILFIVFLLTTTFSIMNVIVAVIVEGTLGNANDRNADAIKRQAAELEKHASKVAEMFCATDADSDGQVTKDEFMTSMKRPDVLAYLSEVGIDMRQAENLFDILDYDDSGSLDADEFSRGVLKARGEAQAQDVLSVQCELWRYELKIKDELQALCIRVDADMSKVDEQLDLLRMDVSGLDEVMSDLDVPEDNLQSLDRTTDVSSRQQEQPWSIHDD